MVLAVKLTELPSLTVVVETPIVYDGSPKFVTNIVFDVPTIAPIVEPVEILTLKPSTNSLYKESVANVFEKEPDPFVITKDPLKDPSKKSAFEVLPTTL